MILLINFFQNSLNSIALTLIFSLQNKFKLSPLFLFSLFFYFLTAAPTLGQNKAELDSLEKILPSLDDTLQVKTYNKLCWEYRNNNPIKALQFINHSIELSNKIQFEKGLAEAYNFAGTVHRKLGNYDKAISFFFQCLKLSEKIKDKTQIAFAYNNLGEVYTYQSDYENAEKFLNKALDMFKALNNKVGEAYALIRFGELAQAQKKYEQALDYFTRCATIRKEINDKRGLSSIYANMSQVYYIQNNLIRAYSYAEKSLSLRDLNDKSGMAQSLLNLAQILYKQKKYKRAEEEALASLRVAEEFKSKKFIAQASFLLSNIYKQMQQPVLAFDYLMASYIAKDSLFTEETNLNISNLRESYESEKKQNEIENLTKYQKIQAEENNLKTALLYVSAVAFVLISFFALWIYRNARIRHKINQQLELQKAELNLKNIELQHQKEEIQGIAENLKTANEEIVEQKLIIEKKTNDIVASINYAQRIQWATLPSEKVLKSALSDYFIFYKPKDIVSGDFYWVAEKKYKTIIAIADCTGHGIPGAFMSLIGNDLLNEIVLSRNITEPDKILTELKRMIREALRQDESKNHDGMEIGICTIERFPPNFEDILGVPKLEFAGASSPLYYCMNNAFFEAKGNKITIGGFNILERENEFTKISIPLHKENLPFTFYLFSDGYQDQIAQDGKSKFMKRRFRELLFSIHQKPMQEQKVILEKTLQDWLGTQPQIDDILVAGIRIE